MIGRSRALLSGIGVLLALGLAALLIVILGNDPASRPPQPPTEASLSSLVTRFTAPLNAGQDYRPPKADERKAGAQGFGSLLDAGHAVPSALDTLGFSVRDGVDEQTGRPYTMAVNEPDTDRSWGMYLIDRSAPPSIVVEVPHPAFDLRTELFGLAYFRQVPGAVLIIAGAHRKADDSKADVAHEENSLFHVVATTLAARGLPQVQLHGFHDPNMPDTDIVLSAGATQAGDPARRAADRLTADGFSVCRAWSQSCKGLEGLTNVQGRAAAQDGTMFLHVEMSRTVREDEQRRADVVRALTEAKLTEH
ncbi:hypothetical protein [Amycolatopsis sp. H20-H5]|uniref:hypothetical protein n=1 Tax=Amycolatopsis sp. H20-H5 TaxID=3046309 RepID=UPI002DBA2C1B|nr:hypothetical protein [Amycolatopsis sp. H20-H5]MEC3977580.1 hypothetical protein [Amycolatopsis sp. H20-H5]